MNVPKARKGSANPAPSHARGAPYEQRRGYGAEWLGKSADSHAITSAAATRTTTTTTTTTLPRHRLISVRFATHHAWLGANRRFCAGRVCLVSATRSVRQTWGRRGEEPVSRASMLFHARCRGAGARTSLRLGSEQGAITECLGVQPSVFCACRPTRLALVEDLAGRPVLVALAEKCAGGIVVVDEWVDHRDC